MAPRWRYAELAMLRERHCHASHAPVCPALKTHMAPRYAAARRVIEEFTCPIPSHLLITTPSIEGGAQCVRCGAGVRGIRGTARDNR